MISIIMPHLRDNKENDEAYLLNVKMLLENTTCKFELISDMVMESDRYVPDLYYRWDAGVRKAKYDTVVLLATDELVSPGWNEPIQKYTAPGVMTCLQVVESGILPVYGMYINHDFGRSPCEFQRADFEAFARHFEASTPETREYDIWVDTFAFNRDWYIGLGGFDPTHFVCADQELWAGTKPRMIVTNKCLYHFQRLSCRELFANG